MNNEREKQMMAEADAYVEESEEIYNIVEAITDFCAGWRAADSHPNWIPVERELPKRMSEKSRFSDMVLVYTKEGYKDSAYYDYEEKEWKWAPSVTHWMEIQPPQGNEE